MLTSNVWCSAARSWSCSCRSSIRSIWDRAIRTVVTLVHWTCWWYRRWVIRWALWAQCKSVQRWTQYFNRTKALCFRIKGSCHFAISIIIIGWVVLLFRVENLFLGSNDDDEIVSEREREKFFIQGQNLLVHASHTDLDRSLFTNTVWNFAGINPYGQFSGQVFYNITYWNATFTCRYLKYNIDGFTCLQAAKCWALCG